MTSIQCYKSIDTSAVLYKYIFGIDIFEAYDHFLIIHIINQLTLTYIPTFHIWPRLIRDWIPTSGIFSISYFVLILDLIGHVENHDDVIKWKHFPRYWPFVRGIHRSPENSLHKGQCRGALMFSLIYAWINGSVNNREAGDLRRHRAHYEVTVMQYIP